MRFHELVAASNTVAQTPSRLEKIARLAEALNGMHDDEIQIGVAYLSGSLLQGRVGLGWSAISAARMSGAADRPSLELREVNAIFDRIARVSGAGAARERSRLAGELFARSTRDEQDFLVRLLSGDLRQGALEGLLTEAIAKAADTPAAAVREAAMVSGDLGEVAKVALREGGVALSRFAIQLFRPVQPMLASPVESATAAIELLGEAAFEFKLDGARIQVHKAGQEVKVFSRSLWDVTAAVPEVVDIAGGLAPHELILDGEVLALGSSGSPLPFQETMSRFGSRLDVDRLRAERPLTPFFFDCLYADGKSLTAQPQRLRFSALQELGGAHVVPHRVISDTASAESFFGECASRGSRGSDGKSAGRTVRRGKPRAVVAED